MRGPQAPDLGLCNLLLALSYMDGKNKKMGKTKTSEGSVMNHQTCHPHVGNKCNSGHTLRRQKKWTHVEAEKFVACPPPAVLLGHSRRVRRVSRKQLRNQRCLRNSRLRRRHELAGTRSYQMGRLMQNRRSANRPQIVALFLLRLGCEKCGARPCSARLSLHMPDAVPELQSELRGGALLRALFL